ncbi:hypothetical protein TRV_01085 [Trichophyton verrucosum HKI 0517]|uniref:Autophagy-related protein n=1 Tax=Trichophyton verrucosum (strain HKI 0517) TaxID=663202 RepID=D4D1Y3_TRIVH|nr:uncharacterized protein TRV_01085 [Trichophyton verrucosum HKI 0517]EFE44125.1 hypothetical protein TRV_01085 [Trichophyton verrucosum HKI 0517]
MSHFLSSSLSLRLLFSSTSASQPTKTASFVHELSEFSCLCQQMHHLSLALFPLFLSPAIINFCLLHLRCLSCQSTALFANTATTQQLTYKKSATMRSKFKDEHPFEKRKAEAERIRQKYADRIPVICEKVEKSDIATIDKKKYLVPADLTVGQFVYVIRKRIKLSPEKAIFIFVDEVLPPTAALMSSIYEEHKDEDGFLYITYSGENTFGSFPELQ